MPAARRANSKCIVIQGQMCIGGSKAVCLGELAVEITTTADDIEDTTAEMNDTQAFIANLASMCETKKKEWAERSKMRAEEVHAF